MLKHNVCLSCAISRQLPEIEKNELELAVAKLWRLDVAPCTQEYHDNRATGKGIVQDIRAIGRDANGGWVYTQAEPKSTCPYQLEHTLG